MDICCRSSSLAFLDTRLDSSFPFFYYLELRPTVKMDAIKKKMQAMKVEKDNAMDKANTCELAAKDAKVRACKAEVADLVKKAQQLEIEVDKTQEELMTVTEKLKEKESTLSAAEQDVNCLNRRVQALEGDLETCEDKMLQAESRNWCN